MPEIIPLAASTGAIAVATCAPALFVARPRNAAAMTRAWNQFGMSFSVLWINAVDSSFWHLRRNVRTRTFYEYSFAFDVNPEKSSQTGAAKSRLVG